MNDRDRYRLLFGPYRAPYVRKGDVVFCELRGEAVVCGMSGGRIAWPVARHKRGKPFLIVFAGLAEAIRRESNQAVALWWGIDKQTVSKYRKILGVPLATEGTSRLHRDIADEVFTEEVRARAVAAANTPEANAKKSTAKRGKPRPAHLMEALARFNRGRKLPEATRRKMSQAHKRRGTRPPWLNDPWPPEHDALLGTLPDAEVAERTGRTLQAVGDRRRTLGIYRRDASPLTLKQILAWAKAHRRRTGRWPSAASGPVAEAPGQTWRGIDQALAGGFRGLAGGSSLAKLLDEYRRAPHRQGRKG
jgi:hypothetical protein